MQKESAVSKTRASGNALQSLTDSIINISYLLEIVKDVRSEILSKDILDKFNLNRGNSETPNGVLLTITIPILKSALILSLTFIPKRDIFNTKLIFDFPHRQLEP